MALPTAVRSSSDHDGAAWFFPRQHFLYFSPLPHGHGSFRPTLSTRSHTSRYEWSIPVQATFVHIMYSKTYALQIIYQCPYDRDGGTTQLQVHGPSRSPQRRGQQTTIPS